MAVELIFNTQQDYFNYLTLHPEETKKELQKLLDTRFVWQTTAILAEGVEGLTDDTHRVVGEGPERMQQQLVEDPNAKIFVLGFTVEQIEEILNND